MDEFNDDIALEPELAHVGFRCERTIFESGDLERAFAHRWLELNERHRSTDFLQSLLSSGDPGDPVVTQRDATVVATVIQWLGTNVGWGFLCETLRKHGQYEIIDKRAEAEFLASLASDSTNECAPRPGAQHDSPKEEPK